MIQRRERWALFFGFLFLLVVTKTSLATGSAVYFDYYGVKNIDNGETISGNSVEKLTVPCEASSFLSTNDYNLDPNVDSPLGNKTGVTIRYIPKGTIFSNDIIIFNFINAQISSNVYKCWLVFYEYHGFDNDDDGIGEESLDINNNNSHFDRVVVAESIEQPTNQIKFRMFQKVPPNAVLYLACAEDGEDMLLDDNGFNVTGFDTSYNPVIRFDNLYSNSTVYNVCNPQSIKKNICLTISAFSCCPNSEIPDLEVTDPQCFIDVKCQFSLDIKPSLSIIDSYPRISSTSCQTSKSGLIKCYDAGYIPYTLFKDEPSGDILDSDSCTDRRASSGVVTIKQNSDQIDDVLTLGENGWSAQFSLKLHDKSGRFACSDTRIGNKPGYKALDFSHRRIFLDNNGKSKGVGSYGDPSNRIHFSKGIVCSLTANVENSSSCSENSSTICLKNNIWEDDVYVGVTGQSKLHWIKWGLTETLNIFKDNNLVFTIKKDENAPCVKTSCCYDKDTSKYFLFWKPNGEEAFVPYMINTNQFRVIISNNSCWDSEIYARVWDPKGRVAEDVYLGKLGKNSVKILTGDFIFAKARQKNPNLGKRVAPLYSMILTVSGARRDIEFAAYDNRNGKSKMIPIYDSNSYEWTYRNVDFDTDTFRQ